MKRGLPTTCSVCGATYPAGHLKDHLADAGHADGRGMNRRLASIDPRRIAERFWSHVIIVDRGHRLGPCWEWTAARHRGKYGAFRYHGRQAKAHRVTLILLGIDPGEITAHHCDNPPCVRPLHLFPTDSAGNNADMMAKGRHRFVSNLPRVIAARQRKEVMPHVALD